jgi:hypothetical protein
MDQSKSSIVSKFMNKKESEPNSPHLENIDLKSNSKFIIRKNIKGILEVVLEEINDFKQPLHMKIKSVTVLFYLVKASGSLLSPYMEKILYPLYNNIISEEDISKKCEETASIIGLSIDQNVTLPLIVKHLFENEIKNSFQPILGRIKTLSFILTKMTNISFENVDMVLKLMHNLDIFSMFSDGPYTKQILIYAYKIFESLTLNLSHNCKKYHESLFFPLLLLSSLPETNSIHTEVKKTLLNLAKFCGFQDLDSLFSLELGCVLEKFRNTHKNWRRNSPDRFAFDTFVKNGGSALEKHWIDVLMIISFCCEADKDIEMRLDMMILIEYCLDSSELSDQVKNYIEFIIPEILLPATAWRAMRPNSKIRKASLVCLIKLFKNNLIETSSVSHFFNDIIQVLKSTLEDDWDPEMRFLSINMLKYLISYEYEIVSESNLTELYPLLLKRLDDSQDNNRILVSEVFKIFFQICQKVRISSSTYEYIVSSAFIHLDDPNENVRRAVLNFLCEAKKIFTLEFNKIVEKNLESFIHKSTIKELL